jgi:hypothetical protein
MKKILRSTAILAASIASMLPIPQAKVELSRQKKQGSPTPDQRPHKSPVPGGHIGPDWTSGGLRLVSDSRTWTDFTPAGTSKFIVPSSFSPVAAAVAAAVVAAERYPWKREIVTTTFWIGEKPGKNNPVPNRASSWDPDWARHYGGTDTPDPDKRVDSRPAGFVPGQNPFYVALPYNDVQMGSHKPEAAEMIPWFKEDYRGPGKSVCKGRWIAIRHKDRVAYAQWEDCGPFRTDHAAYVFGNERPKKNLNKGAGLDVSPAVRDYLRMDDTDVTDWKFVDFDEVPQGPWAKFGDNNTFVINRRLNEIRLAALADARRPPD